ncbi:MAG: 3-phosphoshikimate 1-carboxyvinyltransferase [Chloroflexota bacterium]|nr:3-phosphoshikimate 1-carboxyvinyltransferase [Chloroflexota bacterium]
MCKAEAGLRGHVGVPGDKSVSHRAAIFGAVAEGTTRISNFLPATDCLSTLEVVQGLGIEVAYSREEVLVYGRGMRCLREPVRPLECGGSGTTMRLMAGLLAGQPFYSVLASNAQLGRRPMSRVAVPLRGMGATILGRDGGNYPPLSIVGGNLHATKYRMPVASAQVKSAILLAGLYAQGVTTVEEPAPSRDHTERMLAAMGAKLDVQRGQVSIEPADRLDAIDIRVPGDLSSAAFMLAAAAIVPGSHITIPGVGVNPGRVGFLDALRRMGAEVCIYNERLENGEPVADIELRYAPLRGISISAEEVPGMVDELPVLAVVASQAQGTTEVRGAGELRVKETDRIATTVSELRTMGSHIEALEDGFIVHGPTTLKGGMVSSHGDHRLAMSLAMAALAAEGPTEVEDTACIDDSFPGFEQALSSLLQGTRQDSGQGAGRG